MQTPLNTLLLSVAREAKMRPGEAVVFVPRGEIDNHLAENVARVNEACASRVPLNVRTIETDECDLYSVLLARRYNVGSLGGDCYLATDASDFEAIWHMLVTLGNVQSLDDAPLTWIPSSPKSSACYFSPVDDACRDAIVCDASSLEGFEPIPEALPEREAMVAPKAERMAKDEEGSSIIPKAVSAFFNRIMSGSADKPKKKRSAGMGGALRCSERLCLDAEGAQPSAEPEDESEALVGSLEREKREFIDRVSALIVGYVQRFGEMPPMDKVELVCQGKISLAKGGLSRLVVNRECRFVLPEYNEMELPMRPVQRAVYILFLRHPEGIAMRGFPDCRDELSRIYLREVMPTRDDDVFRRTLDRLCDSFDTSALRENLSCINRIVRSRILNEAHAQQYCVLGKRGEPYGIALQRDLVVFNNAKPNQLSK